MRPKSFPFALFVAVVTCVTALPRETSAQGDPAAAFPSRTVTIIVPFPPGGPPDVIARVVAAGMQDALGKPVVVENRPGASTTIAHQAVARADADGHTVLAVDTSHAVVPHIMAKAGFDPLKDFKPVGRTAQTVLTVALDAALPVKSAGELVTLAKQKPGTLKVAHTGIGTPPHLGAVAFIEATGVDVLLVPYKGAAQALSDVAGGHVSMLVTGPSTSVQLHKAGKVRVVGLTGPKRLTSLPDVPTLKESGIDTPSLDNGVWFGLVVPAATPDAIVARLNTAMNKAVSDPATIATLGKTDIATVGGTPQALAALVRTQLGVWGELMRKAQVKLE